MQTIFEVSDLRAWREEYDESEPEAVTAVLTVETDQLRHVITVTGLQDARWLNEVFGHCPGLRVQFDEEKVPQYILEVVKGDWVIPFTVTSFAVDTRSLRKQPH